MGRKVFTREVLTSADVQNFLMDQTVMSYASRAARAAEIPAPQEGWLTFLRDEQVIEAAQANGSWKVVVGPTYSVSTTGGGTFTVANAWLTPAIPARVTVPAGTYDVSASSSFALSLGAERTVDIGVFVVGESTERFYDGFTAYGANIGTASRSHVVQGPVTLAAGGQLELRARISGIGGSHGLGRVALSAARIG